MIEQTSYNFLPVIGEEKKILNQTQTPGSIYFTTDTGKIYLDLDSVDKNKLPLGGQVNLYYGQMSLKSPPADGTVKFPFQFPDDIVNTGTSNSKPGVNDLILNQDGCFYKVLESLPTVLQTEKLTIAGTGGGGGGSVLPSNPNDKTSFVLGPLKTNPSAIIQGNDCFLTFAVEAHNEIGEYVSRPGSYNLIINDSVKESGNLIGITSGSWTDYSTIDSKEFMSINIGPYLKSFDGSVQVKIQAISNANNNTRPVNEVWVDVSNMVLTWAQPEIETKIQTGDSLTLNWTVSGTNILKTTYLQINNEMPIEIASGTKVKYDYLLKFNDHHMTHGVYTLKMWVEGKIGNNTVPSDPFYKNIFVVDENNDTPLISVKLFDTVLNQYDTTIIPVIIYDPDIDNSSSVQLYEGSNLKDTWPGIRNLEPLDWTYTPMEASNRLSLIVAYKQAIKSIPITVNPIDIKIEEPKHYAFKFKANEFASNNAVQSWSGEYDGEKYSVSFSDNFDWINGGLKSKENSLQKINLPHILIKAGTTMNINYPMWKKNAPGFGKHLKIIFKAINCKNYDAKILSCKMDKKRIDINVSYDYLFILRDLEDANGNIPYAELCTHDGNNLILNKMHSTSKLDLNDEASRLEFTDKYIQFNGQIYKCSFKKQNPEDKDSPYYAVWHLVTLQDSFNGIEMTASKAFLKSDSISLETQYCDEEYIELEMEILKRTKDDVRRYAKFWIDGVPSNYIQYGEDDNSFAMNIPSITIGSNECDVLIYQIKFYESSLDIDEHMNNFYIDAPSGADMIARYNRNNIISGQEEIDPELVAAANPDLLVHIYEIPPGHRMPMDKKDEQPCIYKQYQGKSGLKYEDLNAKIKVQGTSSEKYVLAAANLDTKFTEIRNAKTNEVLKDGWSMTDDAYPITKTCTKVNVASCENANNALNQDWYNMFQPYKSVLRCKNEKNIADNNYPYKLRDTMQFTNGVIFVKDGNMKFDLNAEVQIENNVFGDTVGYMGNEYPKFYSIGQMGNSKDNLKVFHDHENPKECCIEVKDNQMPEQQMIRTQYNKEDIGTAEKLFEFRYPDKDEIDFNDAQIVEMKTAWNNLVEWFALNDPSPKYKKFDNITTDDQFNDFAINKVTQDRIAVWYLDTDDQGIEYYKQLAENEGRQDSITTYYIETEHVNGYTDLPLPTDKVREYKSKTFTTIHASDYNNKLEKDWQEDYVSILDGFTTNEYNYLNFVPKNPQGNYISGTYDKVRYGSINADEPNGFIRDCYEYRMAKLLDECEEHLIMESLVYHFLFIERHCMIDNVAKNTFWSTEDCKHWNLIKDYDNDTSDGNDNNGHFTRTYGMEPLDMLNDIEHVFNAYQSVWFNFINGLHEVCEKVYQTLETKEVQYPGRLEPLRTWDAEDYLWLFNKWQSQIPERCWIEDYYRKYFRPYELYRVSTFNPMIEGGQKKYQRAHFEKYQEIYMASKYRGSAATTSYVWMRPSTQGVASVPIPVKVYADCYVNTIIGGQMDKTRLKRGEWGYFNCPVPNVNNATAEISPAKLFTHLGEKDGIQLGDYTPAVLSFSGCTKLQELYYGSEDITNNPTITTGISFDNNPLLEKLYICNLTNYTSSLDLSSCINLKEFDSRGSNFPSVTFADNGLIEFIRLNSPTSIKLSNLTKLNNLTILSKGGIGQLRLNNIDTMKEFSKTLTEDALANFTGLTEKTLAYKLTNVNWTLSDKDFTQEKINILEDLLNPSKANPVYNDDSTALIPKSQALTGKIIVPESAYNDSDSIDLYNKYVQNAFSNLDIEFQGSNAKLCNIIIYDGNNNIIWKKCIRKGTNLTNEFYLSGPFGSFTIDKIGKADSADKTYIFEGKWKINNWSDIYTYLDQNDIEKPVLPTYNNVTVDLHFYPQFTESVKRHIVTIKAKNPLTNEITIIPMANEQSEFSYGTLLQTIVDQITEIPYITNPEDDVFVGYDLIGYSFNEFGNTPINLNTEVLKDDVVLWAVFKKVDNMRECAHEEWFTIQSGVCSPKYKLGGKITIPATIRGEEVKSLADFVPNFLQVTHIFLQNGNTLTTVKKECFYVNEDDYKRTYKLVYFDFENATSLTTVEYKAFCGLQKLLTCDLTETKLTTIGQQAFNASFALQSTDISSPNVIKLPDTITSFGTHAFAYNFYISPQSVVELPSAIIQIEIGCNGQGINTNNFNLSKQGDTVFASYKEWNPLTLKINVDSLNNVNSYVEWLSENIPTESSNIIIKNGSGEPIYSGPGKKEEQT